MKELLKPSLNWLLVFLPATIWLHFAQPESATAIFLCACLSILPLAGWLGKATEHLQAQGETVGGLLSDVGNHGTSSRWRRCGRDSRGMKAC